MEPYTGYNVIQNFKIILTVTGIVINIYTIHELVTFMLTWNEAREPMEGKKRECSRGKGKKVELECRTSG